MGSKIILSLLFGILLFGLVSVRAFTISEINQISCSAFEAEKTEIIGVEIPKQIPYSDEIFNIYIEEEIFGSIEIINSTISDFGCIENEDRTYEVYIKDYSVLSSFGESDDFFGTFQENLKNKNIEIEGVGFGKKVKMFFTKIGLKIFGWFN